MYTVHVMYNVYVSSADYAPYVPFDCDSGSIDLWAKLLTRLKQKLQRRKEKGKKTNAVSGMRSSRLEDKDTDGDDEEENENENEVIREESTLVDQDSSNVSNILCQGTYFKNYKLVLPIGSWVFGCCPVIRTQTQSNTQISESY